jgi:hypothetical protein
MVRGQQSGCSFSAQHDHAKNQNRESAGDRTNHKRSFHGYLLSRHVPLVRMMIPVSEPRLRRLRLPSTQDNDPDNDHCHRKGNNANNHV